MARASAAPDGTAPQLGGRDCTCALAATTNDLRVPAGILLLIPVAFLFLLVVATVVVLPAALLPARVAAAVDGRREDLMFVALCALSLGFVLVFFVALASS